MPRRKPREPEKRIAYKVGEVAEMLGCNRKTVWRWLQKGILREVPIPGGHRLVDVRSLEKLMNEKAKS
jgi:excisionase family DNA binding protein